MYHKEFRVTQSRFPENVDIVKADVMNYQELVKAMTEIDIAYYLIHSMEGSSKDWKKFAARDRLAAETFARAATYCGIKRIIYLGGLSTKKVKNGELSEHLRQQRRGWRDIKHIFGKGYDTSCSRSS